MSLSQIGISLSQSFLEWECFKDNKVSESKMAESKDFKMAEFQDGSIQDGCHHSS